MDSLAKMNEALHYLEENLTEEIDYSKVAATAYCSEYHFKRMFSFLAGITLSEYVRRRRLSMVAQELQQTNLRIIDVAIKYGYSSPDSFARAFQSLHGLTPTAARDGNKPLKAYPKMTFQLSIQGGSEMNYRIIEKDPFRVIGLKKRVPLFYHGVNPEIAAMWESLTPETITTLKELSNIEPAGLISAFYCSNVLPCI